MTYTIIISKKVKKKLIALSRTDRVRITEKIEFLGFDPDHSSLDMKKLSGEPFYRLRVGDWRIIFDRDDRLRIIAIEKLAARGGVYK